MSFEERNSIAGLLSSLIAWAIMGGTIWTRSAGGAFDVADGPMVWARLVFWLILICIGVTIALTILFSIAYTLATGEKANMDLKDERDEIIALRGSRITLFILSAGVLSAMGHLALGGGVIGALNMLLAGSALGDTIGTAYRVWRYRRGF